MENEFKVKKVLCDPGALQKTIHELETKWVEALLLRARVPKIMIDKKTSGQIGNAEWRDYLISNFGINIFFDLDTKMVSVFKYNNNLASNTKVGEWYKPEITKKKGGSKYHCEVRLKYWQLI